MKEAINHSQVPFNYTMCLNEECPKADTCLRQLIVESAPADVPSWTIISPKYFLTHKDGCRYYQPSTKVRFAKGFIKLLGALPHNKVQMAASRLTTHFGRTTYYRVRKGERLLSPREQEEFLEILKSCGVTLPVEFDAYMEDYDWFADA